MEEGELFLAFTEPIERIGLQYMVTGSVASSSYGEPRFTHDIDIVVLLPPDSADEFARQFPLEEFYCPPPDVLREEGRRTTDGHFNLIHHRTGFKADIYVASDPLHRWALAKRMRVEVAAGRSLWLAPAEYVILRKLQFHAESGSERHVRDIESMLQVSPEGIDEGELEFWVGRPGLEAAWKPFRR